MKSLPSAPDYLFYPLAALAAGALIWAAFIYRPVGDEPLVSEDRFLVEGAALASLIPGPGTAVSFNANAAEGAVAAANAVASLEAAGHRSAGVAAAIPPEFEEAVKGEEIEIVYEVRAADPDQSTTRIAYFVVGDADSGWREVPVSTQFQEVSFRHRIPADAPSNEREWVGIWPDPEGMGRTVLIRRIEVRILPRDGEAETDG